MKDQRRPPPEDLGRSCFRYQRCASKYLRIDELNWCRIPRSHHPEYAGDGSVLYAIWPGPVGHDLCFDKAGYEYFADQDEDWDLEFRNLSYDLFSCLRRRFGEARIRQGLRRRLPRMGLIRGLFNREECEDESRFMTSFEQLLAAAFKDDYLPVILEFGDPPRASLSACAGHPFYLMEFVHGRYRDPLGIVNAIRRNLVIKNRVLEWQHLLGWYQPHLKPIFVNRPPR